ncbi:neutral zinc metallopeptidase [Mycetocola sp. JXN-3]|uniref:KPN_02809 family neutral zinc metallopeptidase n=1 Tax=Mycetocola sp. JXN-3 TaxID=2116510 RepID=UPI00165D0FEC|nr:neutral zinc metallopeptidase [Mycetocola sp. JXN-3]
MSGGDEPGGPGALSWRARTRSSRVTFNPNSDIGGTNVKRAGRGRTTGLALGGGGLGVIAIFLIAQFTGVDLSGFLGGTEVQQPGAIVGQSLEGCKTGQDANNSVDCRMAGAAASLDPYWTGAFTTLGARASYHTPEFTLFSGSTSTGCGAATSATGPFYCPGDETIYIDTAFFDQLSSQFGAHGGPLAELYIVAHEWGHHIQNLEGTFDTVDRTQTGPTSGTVRIELQADCYAGSWVGSAANVRDRGGNRLIEPPTDAQIRDALDAAAAVGDDRIQELGGGSVHPEAWTHGSSDQRQRWFLEGYRGGATACNTFDTKRL